MTEHSPSTPSDQALPFILVVDDDPETVVVTRQILEGAGYFVEDASDGSVALDRLQRAPLPDLIVVDLIMPEMDGWQLVTELRARPELAQIPVVVVSAGGDRLLGTAPVSAGYLAKPFDPERLVETVEVNLFRRGRPSGKHPVRH